MGNRAAVLFGDGKDSENIGVCLQWNGGPESIYAFTKLLASYRQSQVPTAENISVDSASMATRFCQLVTNYFAQSSSDFLSIHLVPKPGGPSNKDLPTEHGIFLVKPDFSIERFDYGGKKWTDTERLREFKDVLKHKYWTEEDSIVKAVREANDTAFLRRYQEDAKDAFHDFKEAILPVEKELSWAKIASQAATPGL